MVVPLLNQTSIRKLTFFYIENSPPVLPCSGSTFFGLAKINSKATGALCGLR